MSKLVLIALADRADDSGKCWPSISTLASDCECSRRTVERCLEKLEEKSLISRQRRAEKGMKTSSVYRITVDASDCRIENEKPENKDASDCRNDASQSRIVASQSRNGSVTESHRTSHRNSQETPNKEIGMFTPDPFELFWDAYPRKQKKQDARKAFEKLDVPVETLIQDIRLRLEQREWSTDSAERKWIPLPTTYLNKRTWEDEVVCKYPAQMDAQSVASRTAKLLSEIDEGEPFQ